MRAEASPTTPLTLEPSRRALLGGLAVTALVVGVRVPRASAAIPAAGFAPDAFIRIDKQGVVTLVMPQVEMGQGTYTSISMILAEELDAAWDHVTVERAACLIASRMRP